MKINAWSDHPSLSQGLTSRPQETTGFQTALALAQQKQTAGSGARTETPQNPQTKALDEMTALRKELSDWLKKDPIAHMRDALLKELGLSEEELSQLPPDQRAAIEDYIAEKIKEKLLAATEIQKNHAQTAPQPLSALIKAKTDSP